MEQIEDPMSISNTLQKVVRGATRSGIFTPCLNLIARRQGHGVRKIFREQDIWIHETVSGFYAYPHPYIRLDLDRINAHARKVFFRAYCPNPGDVIVDVGAGVGEETLTFSRAVGRLGRVVCIEAHPQTFRCLEKMIQYNRLENVTAIHSAITEPHRHRIEIEDSEDYHRNRSNQSGGLSVRAATMDEIVDQWGVPSISFLKMNIEGAERLAIQGMSQTLQRTRTLCICCHDFLADTAGDPALCTSKLVIEFLKESGFELITPSKTDAAMPDYVRYQVWARNAKALAATG
jgi:FkbM family methyltransferase